MAINVCMQLSESEDKIKLFVILYNFQRVEIKTFWITDIHMVYRHMPSELYNTPYVYFIRCSTGQVPGQCPDA